MLRHDAILARWGEEEFALALPRCTTDDATTILSLLAETMPDGRTFSAGHTTMQAGESVANTLDRADTLLYTAKRHGRDRIITPGDTVSGRSPPDVVGEAAIVGRPTDRKSRTSGRGRWVSHCSGEGEAVSKLGSSR